MRQLNLDQLRTLVSIADLGSFSAAARALHLAQPTVSLHISELESRLVGITQQLAGTLDQRGAGCGRRDPATAAQHQARAEARFEFTDVQACLLYTSPSPRD